MKKLMMDTIYHAINKAQTRNDLLRISGMLEIFFLHVNTQDITYNDYEALRNAKEKKTREIYNGLYIRGYL